MFFLSNHSRDKKAILIEKLVQDQHDVQLFCQELRSRLAKDVASDWLGFVKFLESLCSPPLAQAILSQMDPSTIDK